MESQQECVLCCHLRAEFRGTKHVDGICDGFVPVAALEFSNASFAGSLKLTIYSPVGENGNSATGWVAWWLSKAWLGAEAPPMCQVYRNRALKTQACMSQPKALVSKSPNAASALPRQWEQIGSTSGSHFTLSPLQEEERRKNMGERRGGVRRRWRRMGGREANIFCNAKQKESRVELRLKEVEINNLAADSVKSALLVAVLLQDKWIRLQSIAVEIVLKGGKVVVTATVAASWLISFAAVRPVDLLCLLTWTSLVAFAAVEV